MAGARHVINMANSIVGVSILSMPFCFKEAGLLLGVVLVLVSGFITKKTCMFLIRSAIMARRRSYEFLAFHVFGVSGKLFVEMCMILFLIGICISFHVVMGDLAPALVARVMNIENSSSLRCTPLIGIALLVVLPLCLLRNLDNLASMSACSIMFYFFLITVIFWHAFPKLWDGSWIHTAELWRPAGALQVLPILSLALACQSNVFEIYDSVPDPDVPKMRFVVNHAVNLCCALYISVGFLGYVAFVDRDFSGNIIMSFPASELTEGIKMFFTVSLAISFPLMIFPCRTSIHSLFYRRSNPSSFDLVGNYMPEVRFKAITLGILLSSLVIGILVPNIEFVLGLLGSTMGMLIALILPSLLFIKVNTKASAERLLAQGIMLMGLLLIVTGTYLNLAHIYEVQSEIKPNPTEAMRMVEPQLPQVVDKIASDAVKMEDAVSAAKDDATRKEPVAPEPPPEEDKNAQKDTSKSETKLGLEKKGSVSVNGSNNNLERDKRIEERGSKVVNEENQKTKGGGDTLHPDAIQKEEKVNEEEIEKGQDGKEIEKKQVEILEKMEEQQQQQQHILEEQKMILKELKDQNLKQKEDAKRQEESKVNVVGAGDLLAPAGGQQPIPPNSDPAVALPVEVNLLKTGNNAMPLDSQTLLNRGGNLAAVRNQPVQNVVPVEYQPDSVVGSNLKQPMQDSHVQQAVMPVANLAGQVVPVANLAGQVVPAANLVEQPIPVANLAGQRVPAANLESQPILPANLAGQAIPVANLAEQSVPVANIAYQINPAANPAGQVVPAANLGQPLSAGNLVGQVIPPANLVGQAITRVNVADKAVLAENLAGQAISTSNIAGQAMPAANLAIQSMLAENLVGKAMPAGNLAGQAMPAANLAGQVDRGQLFAPASFVGQPLNFINHAGLPIARADLAGQHYYVPSNIPGQPVVPANQGSQPIAPANVLGQPVVPANLGDQPVILANLGGQPVAPANPQGQPVAPANIGGQPVVPAYLGGQSVAPANLGSQPVVPANLLGQPIAPANLEGQPVAPANLPGQPVAPANIPGQPVAPVSYVIQQVPSANNAPMAPSSPSRLGHSETYIVSKVGVPVSSKQPLIESEQKGIESSISRKVKEKISEQMGASKKARDKVYADKIDLESKQGINKAEALKKKTHHDEERRKREVDGNLFFGQDDFLSNLKWKEFGDVAYDTRHLLWTGRSSRRKKRNKGRDEDYYWDET